MGDHQSSDDVRASYVAAMGEPLGAVYHALWHQVALLHLRWNSYRGLFAASPQTIALLNSAAPAFFFDTERIMWEDVLLHLCRLTDPPQVGRQKRETLTLKRLPPLVEDLAIRAEVQRFVDAADQRTQFARDWRNRRLAHTELPPLFGEIQRPLAIASREHVENALAAFRDVMNLVSRSYGQGIVGYEHSIGPLGGVENLLARLRDGVESRRQRFRDAGVPDFLLPPGSE